MKGRAFVTALQIKQRAAFNVALDDGREITINDDDRTQGIDPGTGRSVDAGGCGYTLYNSGGTKVREGHDARLGYANNFPYEGIAFEVPGELKLVQDGPAIGPENGYYELRFMVAEAA